MCAPSTSCKRNEPGTPVASCFANLQARKDREAAADAALARNASSLAQQRMRLHQALLGPSLKSPPVTAAAGSLLHMPAVDAESAMPPVSQPEVEEDSEMEASAVQQFAQFMQRSKALQVTLCACNMMCLKC